MTAGEDQAQPVVGDFARRSLGQRGIIERFDCDFLLEQQLFFAPRALAPTCVDQLAVGRRRDPAGRIVRNAALGPMAQRRGKGLLHRLLGAVERAAQPDQAGDDPAVLAAKHRFDRGANFSQSRPSVGAALPSAAGCRPSGGSRCSLRRLARGRDLGGPGDRLVEVLAIENVVPGELLFGLGEGAVEDRAACRSPCGWWSPWRSAAAARRNEHAFLPGFVHNGPMPCLDPFPILGRGLGEIPFAAVDQKHVAHGQSPVQLSMVQDDRPGNGGGTASLTLARAIVALEIRAQLRHFAAALRRFRAICRDRTSSAAGSYRRA